MSYNISVQKWTVNPNIIDIKTRKPKLDNTVVEWSEWTTTIWTLEHIIPLIPIVDQGSSFSLIPSDANIRAITNAIAVQRRLIMKGDITLVAPHEEIRDANKCHMVHCGTDRPHIVRLMGEILRLAKVAAKHENAKVILA